MSFAKVNDSALAELFNTKSAKSSYLIVRRLAEDRKNYFDTMERHMFSSKQSTKGTGRESVRTSSFKSGTFGKLCCKFFVNMLKFSRSSSKLGNPDVPLHFTAPITCENGQIYAYINPLQPYLHPRPIKLQGQRESGAGGSIMRFE